MPVDLFTVVDLYDRALGSAIHILGKGAEHAAKIGVSEADLLGWRLVDDMNPLTFQLQVLANFTRQWPARVAGLDVPPEIANPADVAGWTAALQDARGYLAGLTREQFAGKDDVPITFKMGSGMEPTLPGGQWLSVFVLMNIEFHLSMAYAILRARRADRQGGPVRRPALRRSAPFRHQAHHEHQAHQRPAPKALQTPNRLLNFGALRAVIQEP